jgi:hypothetical protein
VDASTPAELVEKRKGGLEKRSNDGVQRKRGEKTLDGSPMEASLRGMVEVHSASIVGRVPLQEAGEKGGPWPFILWTDPHDAEKATLFGTLFLEGKGRREIGGVWFVNVSNVALGRAEIQASDKNVGMKSHDHEVQWVSKAAAKAAENSVQCPGT